ncbi:hypothetical protein MTO96_052095 [Rhipicephalus appendiculatus]
MCVVHRCTKYKGRPDACTNCRKPGHRYDVCPVPRSGLCPRCGEKHDKQETPCAPICILCGGEPPYRHRLGGRPSLHDRHRRNLSHQCLRQRTFHPLCLIKVNSEPGPNHQCAENISAGRGGGTPGGKR